MKNSIEDIVKNNLCVGCGLCISESKTSKMKWDENGFLVPDLDHSFTEKAVKVCPSNPFPDKEVGDEDVIAEQVFANASNFDFEIGRFESTYIGYSHAYRNTSSSGGIATFIFEQLLLKGIVDHLFIVKEIDGSYGYQWFNTVEQISNISKTRYIPVTLEQLFKEIDAKQGKVAVSGVGCFIKAIRLKQHYYPIYKEKIPFLIGIICGGLKSNFFTQYLAQHTGIIGAYKKQEYRIKDEKSTAINYSFGAFNDANEFFQVKMPTLGDMWGTGFFKANACDFCDDVTTELADISLGDAWLPEYMKDGLGNSIIITRSKLADQLVLAGMDNKELAASPVSKKKVILSQKSSFLHRQDSIHFRIKSSGMKIYKRPRFRTQLSFSYQIVQRIRRLVRSQSLGIWRKYHDIHLFKTKMAPYLKILRIATVINHKFRK